MAREEDKLNFGHHGVCKLLCLCIKEAIKSSEGRNDVMKLTGPQLVVKYAYGNIRKQMEYWAKVYKVDLLKVK